MVKNLYVNTRAQYKISKKTVHDTAYLIKKELEFDVSSVIINFISSNEIIEINKKYLGHNYSTDIITFNYSGSNEDLDGEIFISVDDACENAIKFRARYQDEIIRLVIHGFLHLLGFDDTERAKKKEMKKWENKLCRNCAEKISIK